MPALSPPLLPVGQSGPAPAPCWGLCPRLRAPQLPPRSASSLWLSAAQPSIPQTSGLGWGERVCESPCFPLHRAAAELQATARVAVTLSLLCLGLSQLLPSWTRLGDRRDESQGEETRRYRLLLGRQAFRELIPPTLGPFAWRVASPEQPSVFWLLPRHHRPRRPGAHQWGRRHRRAPSPG